MEYWLQKGPRRNGRGEKSWTPPQITFIIIKYRRFGLVLVSFFKESACLHSSVQMSSADRE